MGSVPKFDPEAGEPGYLYAAVADHITARINSGELSAGGQLPGERALADEYGVALGTARRAVAELRDRGIVVTLPGKGTFITRSV
jgi:GntR family transcriptional regulator